VRSAFVAAIVLLTALLPAASAGADDLAAAIRGLDLVPLSGAAPGFTLELLAGGARVSLADMRGKPALLYFFATW
jgi:cytochrome oxidase Cu insertion factor (SCO1/SenC/PrrC family)